MTGRRSVTLMTEINADVWIVTEGHDKFPLPGQSVSASASMLAKRPCYSPVVAGRQLTPLPMPEVPTGAASLVSHKDQQYLVVGTDAGVVGRRTSVVPDARGCEIPVGRGWRNP